MSNKIKGDNPTCSIEWLHMDSLKIELYTEWDYYVNYIAKNIYVADRKYKKS